LEALLFLITKRFRTNREMSTAPTFSKETEQDGLEIY